MAKYPHYKNSRASINKYEPLFGNLFEAIIKPPKILQFSNFDLILEHITKVDGLDTIKAPAKVTQKYKGTTRSYSAPIVDDTSIEVTFDFTVNLNDENSAYVLKALQRWLYLIYNPMTGTSGLKKDYCSELIIVSAFNQNREIYRQWKLYDAFPNSSIPVQSFDYDSPSNIYTITGFKFVVDYWEEVII